MFRGGKIRGGGRIDTHGPRAHKPESVEEFRQATVENARVSVQKPGIARFDVVRQQDDATRRGATTVYR